MQHLSPKSLIAAVAAAAVLGATAPAAVAAPHADRPAHTKVDRDAAKADRATARESAKAERDAAKASKAEARVTRALTRLAGSHQLAKLDDANEAAVAANIAADLAAVTGDMRPHVYRLVVNQLRFAERLTVAAEADAAGSAAVAEVVTQLLAVTAVTPKADLRVTKRALQEWAYLLEDETEVEAPEETEETQLEQPAETPTEDPATEPAPEEPTSEAPAEGTTPVDDGTTV